MIRTFMIFAAVNGLLAVLPATGEASFLLGTAGVGNDATAVNDVAGTLFTQSENLRAKIEAEGGMEGDLVDSFTVMDGDGGAYGDEDLSVRFWLENVPEQVEPIYVAIKYGPKTDVYQWDTSSGDVKEDNGNGTFDYHSMLYSSANQNAISHVSVLNIPEPPAFNMYGLGAILCLVIAKRRYKE